MSISSVAVPLPWRDSSCLGTDSDFIIDSMTSLDTQKETMLNKGRVSKHLLENQEQSKKKNVCEYCDRRFNEYSNLIKHRRIHTGSKPYKCELCGKAFTQSSNLNVHKKRCNGSYVKQAPFKTALQIKKCSNLNFKKKLIAEAIPDHDTATVSAKNDKTNSSFDQTKEQALEKDISPRVVENIPISNSNICRQLQYQKCIRKENSLIANPPSNSLEVSLNSAISNVPISQKVSTESLSRISLTQHSNKYTYNKRTPGIGLILNKRRTYPCEYCNRRFNESSNLIKHRRIHTGQRPYKCTLCGKDFTQSSNLNVHSKICKGQYFSKTSYLSSSIKSARLSTSKFRNELTKIPKFGAFENSVSSQLSYQDGLLPYDWGGARETRDVVSTSSVNNFISQLHNVTNSFSSNGNQPARDKYIPLSSHIQSIRKEYAENDTSRLNGEQIGLTTYTENNDRTKQQNVHAKSRIYKCEFCSRSFIWSSTLDIHQKSCVKKLSLDTGTSSGNSEANSLKELTYKSQNLHDFNYPRSSFVQHITAANDDGHIDYIVIDDECDDDEVKGDIQQEIENNIGSESAGHMEDLKPVFIKNEPENFQALESVPTFDNLSLSEVDSKSILLQTEPFPSVLEVKQEPVENEDLFSTNVLNIKQEICNEEYDENQVFNHSSVSNLGIMQNNFESEMVPVLENELRPGDLEINNKSSGSEINTQNSNASGQFQNSTNQKNLNSQLLLQKSFSRLQCHLPSCKGRTFKSITTFQVHMRVHNGQKPYVCEICKKSFNERSNYTKHLRIHSGYKPYKCTLCGHAFTQSSNLNVHRRKCRGLDSVRTTSSNSVSVGWLKSKNSATNNLSKELCEYNLESVNTGLNSVDSSPYLASHTQSNIKFLGASKDYGLNPSFQEQSTVDEKINRYSIRSQDFSKYSQDRENVMHSTFCDQIFAETPDSIKPRIKHSISKPYKCSFCHRAFIYWTNYNVHKASCRRKPRSIQLCDSSVVRNSESKNTNASPENPNHLSPSNSYTYTNVVDADATQVASDHHQMKSSIYFCKKNKSSLISSQFGQQQNREVPVDRNFPEPLIDVIETKVNLNKPDQNSNTNIFLDTDNQSLNQPVSLEKSQNKALENRASNFNSLDPQSEIRIAHQADVSNPADRNLTSNKTEDDSKILHNKTSPHLTANQEKVFRCKVQNCRKVFHCASELNDHAKQHRRRGVHVCKFCSKKFNESSNLIKHRRIHTGAKPYKCEFCNKFFSQSSNRNVHRKSCSKSSSRNPGFLSGISKSAKTQTVVRPDVLRCEICLQQFKQVSDLYAHKNTCKLKNNGEMVNSVQKKSGLSSNFFEEFCQEQPKSPSPSESRKEQLTDFRKQPLVPPSHRNHGTILKSVFAQKPSLNGLYMFQCPYRQCGKIFKMASVLRIHIKDHSEKQQYQCEFCGQKFNSSSNLFQHCQIHTRDKSYSCFSCGKLFTQFSDLNEHSKMCNDSGTMDTFPLNEDHVDLDEQNQTGLAEKSSEPGLQITGTVKNTLKTSNQKTETYNQVINIDDDDDDDDANNESNGIQPAGSVLSSSISVSYAERDAGDKICNISSDSLAENILRSSPIPLGTSSKNGQSIQPDVIMIEHSPDPNIQEEDPSQKGPEDKNKPYDTFNQTFERANSLDNMSAENSPVALFGAASGIRSGSKSSEVCNDLPLNDIQKIKNSSTLSSKSNACVSIDIINTQKPSTKSTSCNLTNEAASKKSFTANHSDYHSIFICKGKSCRKVFRSEQELRTHHCKRRTYPCEYCHRRFNESSNLIKHRRIHTGHKPYKCKFCGRNFTQSSNLNVHRKACAKKHSLVEHRFTQHPAQHRNISNTEFASNNASSILANGYHHEINLSKSSDHISDNVEGRLANSGGLSANVPSVSSTIIGNSSPVTKVEEFVSAKEKFHENSGIIVENSFTGEVELQISERELSALENKEPLPDVSSQTNNLAEFKNLEDDPQMESSQKQVPAVLKKEFDSRLDSEIVVSQETMAPLKNLNISQSMTDSIHNSNRSVVAFSPQLELASDSVPLQAHKSNSHVKTLKMSMHSKNPTKRRTYACEFCKRRFNESSNLIKHRRIHLGLRPYNCHNCGRTFTQSSNCNVHKKICAQKYQLSSRIGNRLAPLLGNIRTDLSGDLQTDQGNKHQKSDVLQNSNSDVYNISTFQLNLNHKKISPVSDRYYKSMSLQDASNNNETDSGVSAGHYSPKFPHDIKSDYQPSAILTTGHYTMALPHDTNHDNGLDSIINSNEPICSISSVRSLREVSANDVQLTKTEAESVNTNLLQDIRPLLNDSELANPEHHPSIDKNEPFHLVPRVNVLDADLSINLDFSPGSRYPSSNNSLSSIKQATRPMINCNSKKAFLSHRRRFPRKYLQCQFCPRLCKNSADYQRHFRVHSGHKPYKCKICNRLFTDYSNFSKHRRVHTGFKPYKCNLCLREFSQSSNLNVHKKHCKGIQDKGLSNSANLSFHAKRLTSLAGQVNLNSLTSQILSADNLAKSNSLTASSQRDQSSTSEFIAKPATYDAKPQSKHFINKTMPTSCISAAQRISLKYLNKITSRSSKTISKDLGISFKTQMFQSKDHGSLNPAIPVANKTSARIPEITSCNQALNNFASHFPKNDYLQIKNIGSLGKDCHTKNQPNSAMDKNKKYICSIRSAKRPNNQTKQKGYVGFRAQRKRYYCEFCNQPFNECSNLIKHRRIHTGQKPYKCQFCNRRFTQSSNLNVHKKICKAYSQNHKNTKEANQSLKSLSVFEASSEGGILEAPSRNSDGDLFSNGDYSNGNKQSAHYQKTEDSVQFQTEENSKNLTSLQAERACLTKEASSKDIQEPKSQKTDYFLSDPEDKNSRQSDGTVTRSKSPVHKENLFQDSISKLNNTDISVSSPKHQTCNLQENCLQSAQSEEANRSVVTENGLHLAPARKTEFVDRLTIVKENEGQDSLSAHTGNINKHPLYNNTEMQREELTCSSSDQEKNNNQSLDIQILDQIISSNQTGSTVNKRTVAPELTRMNTMQSLPNHNKNFNESHTQNNNAEHFNPQDHDMANPGFSDARLELIESGKKDLVHPSCSYNDPAMKHEDVFSCQGGVIELVQLPAQQSDMMKSIQSAISGILQTEEIASSRDQALFQNTVPDWFKIEPVSSALNNISSSNKPDLTHVSSSINQIDNCHDDDDEEEEENDEDDDDDVIIMDTLANFQPVKTNFTEETQRSDRRSYPAVFENGSISSFDNTVELSTVVKTEPSNHLQCLNTNKGIAASSLINTLQTTGFFKSDFEKTVPDYQLDRPSVQDCNIPDQSLLSSDSLIPNYTQQQFDSNNLAHKNDDDIAIIDIKSTLQGKLYTNSSVSLSNFSYNSCFNNIPQVSPDTCENNMDVFSEGNITKQIDHVRESFDYLVPNITDQFLDDNSSKEVAVSCQSNQQDLIENPSCAYMCEFCHKRFMTSDSLVNHCCPNTGDKPYVCPDCGKAFTLYANVISHKSSCVKLPDKMADFSALSYGGMNKNVARQSGDYGTDIQVSTIDLNQWGEEYSFNPETCGRTFVPATENGIATIQDSEPSLTLDQKILENYETKTTRCPSKYENQLPEFPPQNMNRILNNSIPMEHSNAFNFSVPGNNQPELGNKSRHFFDNSFTNSAANITNILSSAEPLSSDNIDSSSSSIKTVPLETLSSNRLPTDTSDFLTHPNKHTSFSSNDFSYPLQNSVSDPTDSNVLLKDFSAKLIPDQTGKYSLSTPSSSSSSSFHLSSPTHTSIPSSQPSSSFINTLDSINLVPCQYCDKRLTLNELHSHTCSGSSQANRYTCTFCKKTLCDASSLSKHLRIHTGRKPYSCEFCGKAFTQSSNLNVHKRVCKDKDNSLQAT